MAILKKPKVAVLLAAYNGMPWIPEQVSSILNQKDVDVTLFVSVDPSVDESLSWFQRQSEKDSRLQLLSVQDSGGASHNFFRLIHDVNVSEYDAVCLSDQDDVWFDDKIIRALSCLEFNSADGYSSNIVSLWANGKKRLIIKSYPQKASDYLFESPGPGCTFVLTAALYKSLHNFVKENKAELASILHHDWFIYAYARVNNYLWVIDKESAIYYRQHDTNVWGANVGFASKLKRARVVLNGDWYKQVYYTALLLSDKDVAASALVERFNEGRIGFLKMMLDVRAYRRRPFDQCILALASVTFFLIGFVLPNSGFNIDQDFSDKC